ncbi:hypothetical protein ASPZODRAFT_1832334 [Penicilliopsis zonata CBS 506.65]|uniref:Uncharacterized protein n=1 Tax=Penicilliopsis zonata CBS 506.65 TaxID=1073090 RepID=A0A1L9SL66_9EURO|nr:hypothetical protein ASPZODRAFT_1832334 [Penicilliopsis zonata CBS 506.65]OJJ48012.1 hypothetical protein ASPZODRAFT_1832334 [Penicilliopsis zonata CBS 506.65]
MEAADTIILYCGCLKLTRGLVFTPMIAVASPRTLGFSAAPEILKNIKHIRKEVLEYIIASQQAKGVMGTWHSTYIRTMGSGRCRPHTHTRHNRRASDLNLPSASCYGSLRQDGPRQVVEHCFRHTMLQSHAESRCPARPSSYSPPSRPRGRTPSYIHYTKHIQ